MPPVVADAMNITLAARRRYLGFVAVLCMPIYCGNAKTLTGWLNHDCKDEPCRGRSIIMPAIMPEDFSRQ